MKVADVLQDEQLRLMPNPKPFDGYVEVLARVSSTSEPLGSQSGRAAWVLACGGGHCRQEHTHVLGDAEQRRCIQATSRNLKKTLQDFVSATA